MTPATQNFLKHLGILSLGVAAVITVLYFTVPNIIHPHIWGIQGFLILMSLATYPMVKRTMNTENFSNGIMGSTGIRLFGSLIAMMIYLFTVKVQPVLFAFSFFILYFLYVGFEIRTLLSNLRENSESVQKKS